MFSFLGTKQANAPPSLITSSSPPPAPAPAPSVSFGANLPVGNKALSAEISEVGHKFVRANKKYRDEIDKYKKIAEFNKKLSSSYITNVHAMIDVSKLLNDYALFFNLLKEEIEKTEGQIGTLKTEDIQYLENLTKAKMEEFSNRFVEQSEKVKVLYNKYGQPDEARTIGTAQEYLKGVVSNAGVTYQGLLNATRQKGGKKTNPKPISFKESKNKKTMPKSTSKPKKV